MRKVLLFIFFIVLLIALVYKSPFSAMYNYNKAKTLYKSGQYEQSLPYFEKSLFAAPKNVLTRFYYVLALSKSKPAYTVQKKLYEMANSKITDEAQKTAKAQAVALRYKLLEGINGNFIFNAAMGNDIVRWDIKSFPLKVYFENPDTVPEYYVDTIKQAQQQWQKRTNFVKFQQTDNPAEANIVIKFKDVPKDVCKGKTCTYTVAYTEPDISNGKILKKMTLTFYKTNPYNKGFTRTEIFDTALHETGHTLGIMGHSENPDDAMFALNENTAFGGYFPDFGNKPSMNDLRTLALLYRIKPTISNTKDLQSENFYYAPLILGNNDVRLQKKLKEYEKYIQQYPNLASGYINIAGVYTYLGDYKSAQGALNKAEPLAANNDEKYIIKYNTAVICFNQQDYAGALEFANKAKAVKDDKNIRDFIADIEKLKK